MEDFPDTSEEVDEEELKRAKAVWARFEQELTAIFLDRRIDWAIVGETTGNVFRTGTDDELPTLEAFAALIQESEEPLLVLGRTIYIDSFGGDLSCE